MKIRIYERSPLLLFFPRWVRGFTLGRHIFLRGALREMSEAMLRHELIHCCQYAELGIRRFLWHYFWTERKLAYRQKSFEREAYRFEHDPQFLARRWPGVRIELPPQRP